MTKPRTPIDAADRRYVRMTKEQAQVMGQVVYWSDSPCSHGHVGWRYVNNYQCWTCTRRYNIDKAARKFDHTQADARRRAERLRDDRELARLESLQTITPP